MSVDANTGVVTWNDTIPTNLNMNTVFDYAYYETSGDLWWGANFGELQSGSYAKKYDFPDFHKTNTGTTVYCVVCESDDLVPESIPDNYRQRFKELYGF
jgi:hypothetical protein